MALSLLLRMACNPRTTGTIFPSSRALAKVMAACVPKGFEVFELGAGTGPVTAVLHERVSETLVAIELQPTLARQLKQKFPSVTVINAPAQAVLRDATPSKPVALVSSLPFKSLPNHVRQELKHEIHSLLARCPGSVLIQFTYSVREPFEPAIGFKWTRVALVWKNLPPACVWTLTAST